MIRSLFKIFLSRSFDDGTSTTGWLRRLLVRDDQLNRFDAETQQLDSLCSAVLRPNADGRLRSTTSALTFWPLYLNGQRRGPQLTPENRDTPLPGSADWPSPRSFSSLGHPPGSDPTRPLSMPASFHNS